MQKINGISVSSGISISKIKVLEREEVYKIKIQSKDSPVKYSRNNQKNCAVASMRLMKQ